MKSARSESADDLKDVRSVTCLRSKDLPYRDPQEGLSAATQSLVKQELLRIR